MPSTLIIAAIFLSLIILQVILWAMFLRLGLRWAMVAEVTTCQIILATGGSLGIQLVLYIHLRLFAPTSPAQTILVGVTELAASVLIPCLVIMQVFKLRFFRALQAWLPTLLSSVAMILFAFFVLRPFICEAFISPTNAMAPTLLGNHWRGRCLECGQSGFCSPIDAWYGRPEPQRMICRSFHVQQATDVPQQAFPPDRFLVAKFLAPRRWDVVVFQYPEDPSSLYVMRLVGLPGETIRIEGGVVWANGTELEPPDSLRGIQYLSELPDWPGSVWGSKDRPAVLGAGEYFVLGDFSPQAKDSRLWQKGAPGHSPFAVPESHLRGVVTHIYWPPQRWRVLR